MGEEIKPQSPSRPSFRPSQHQYVGSPEWVMKQQMKDQRDLEYCHVCNVSFFSREQLSQHMRGAQHAWMVVGGLQRHYYNLSGYYPPPAFSFHQGFGFRNWYN